MSARGITEYYRAALTTNAPVIENICAAGDGRVDSGSPVCWHSRRSVCGVHTNCCVGERERDIEGEGCQQETWTSRSDPMSLVRGDIHLACAHMNVCAVCVSVSEGCKEVSTSLNPLLQRNTC